MPTRTLLLVDDDDDLREVAQASLELDGQFTVLPAASGAEALRIAAEEPVDAVLLDVMMPGMSGAELAVELRARERTRRVPIVLLTATPSASLPATFAELGLHLRVAKPFNPLALGAQVASLLGTR